MWKAMVVLVVRWTIFAPGLLYTDWEAGPWWASRARTGRAARSAGSTSGTRVTSFSFFLFLLVSCRFSMMKVM